jgi:hypothetical protein
MIGNYTFSEQIEICPDFESIPPEIIKQMVSLQNQWKNQVPFVIKNLELTAIKILQGSPECVTREKIMIDMFKVTFLIGEILDELGVPKDTSSILMDYCSSIDFNMIPMNTVSLC